MKFFVIIEGEQKGPYTLEQLPDAGVTPDTYVWRKGLPSWHKAADDADICQFYRNRLTSIGSKSETSAEPDQDPEEAALNEFLDQIPPMFRETIRRSGIKPGKMLMEPETSVAPPNTLVYAIIMTLVCFPPTGFVAIYQSIISGRLWQEHLRLEKEGKHKEESRQIAIAAHEASRNARMWLGITFFLGIIAYAFTFRFL